MTKSDVSDWVWFYYKQGFSIIPVKATEPPSVDNKQPNISSWKKYIDVRPTEEEIKDWLKKGLFKNIGLILGHVSGDIVALDLDDDKIVEDLNIDLDKLMDNFGVWVQVTGKEGRYHLITKHNGDPGNTVKDNLVHLEYRANGAYIVICPSVHPNGKVYHFLNYEEPKDLPKFKSADVKKIYVDMVQKLYQKRNIKRPLAKKSGVGEAECITNALKGGLKEGQRNDTTFALANWYKHVKKLQPTEIRALMLNFNKRNKPPLKASELNTIINSALQSENKTGCNKWKQLGYCPFKNKKDCPFITHKKEKEKKEEVIEQTMVKTEENLYEQVYDMTTFTPSFCYLNEGSVHYCDEIKNNGTKYIPINDKDAVSAGGVIFPNVPMEYGTLQDLINELNEFIHLYMDVPPEFEKFSAWYILFSWVTDNVHTIPYLRVLADFASGKSRFLHTVGRLCYKPTVIAGATTTASVFRSISRWRGTLILEEYNPEKSNFDEDETKILNCGFERGTPVVRCHRETNKLEYFDVFGAKVISSRQPFRDEALNSRCLTATLTETNREDIPILLPEQFFTKQQELRNKLLMFRLKHWKDVDASKINDISFPAGIGRRLKQAFSSFIILFAHDEGALNSFMEFVIEYNKEMVEERASSFDGLIINALVELQNEGATLITSTTISERLADNGITSKNDKPIGTRTIGKHLKTLGIIVKARRIDGKIHKIILSEENEKTLKNLKKKYVVDFGDEIITSSQQRFD